MKKLVLLILLALSITSAEACNFKFICKKLTKLPEYSLVGFKLGWEDVKNGNKLFFPVYEIRGFKNGLQAWRDFGGHEDDPEYLNEKATQIMWNLMEKD